MPEFDSTVEYRDVQGWPGYKVGSDGSVWSNHVARCLPSGDEWHSLVGSRGKNGYVLVSLHAPGVRRRRYVHHLVLEAFVGPCPPGMETCHFPDPARNNNALCNLRWDTRSANARDTRRVGEQTSRAKLTEQQVRWARRACAAGVMLKTIAAALGVSGSAVSMIVSRRRWGHVA